MGPTPYLWSWFLKKGPLLLKPKCACLSFMSKGIRPFFYEPAYKGKHKETVDCSDPKKLPEQLVS